MMKSFKIKASIVLKVCSSMVHLELVKPFLQKLLLVKQDFLSLQLMALILWRWDLIFFVSVPLYFKWDYIKLNIPNLYYRQNIASLCCFCSRWLAIGTLDVPWILIWQKMIMETWKFQVEISHVIKSSIKNNPFTLTRHNW